MYLSLILLLLELSWWKVLDTDATAATVATTVSSSSHHRRSQTIDTANNNDNDDEYSGQYVCGDYLHAIPLTLPKKKIFSEQQEQDQDDEDDDENIRELDFILADVSCVERFVTSDDAEGDTELNDTITATLGVMPLMNSSTITMMNNDEASSSNRRSRKHKVAATTAPQTIHFHFYAVSSEMEMRFHCYPPGFVQPVVGPLPSPLIPTSAVYNVMDLATATMNKHPAESPLVGTSDNNDNSLPSQLEYGLTFVYNSSVPENTTFATIELWIPSHHFDQAVLLGPSFDHSWSVDLTMNPLTSLPYDDEETLFWNVTDWNPPFMVWIVNGGAGTNFVLNTTFASNVYYIDQTLDGTFQIHQVVFGDDIGGNYDPTSSTIATTTMNITTLGSNTLGAIVKETETTTTATTTIKEEAYSSPPSITSITLDGFQQKITIVGLLEEGQESERDYIHVQGLAIEVYTTATCHDLSGFSPTDMVEEDVDLGVDLDLDPNEIAIRRSRHTNYCYELDMTLFQQMEQIPGFPPSVNTTEYFATIVETNGPTLASSQQQGQGKNTTNATTSDGNNNNTNTTNSQANIAMKRTTTTTPFDAVTPLPPYVQSLPCWSITDLKVVDCVLNAAAITTTTITWRLATLITLTMEIWMTIS